MKKYKKPDITDKVFYRLIKTKENHPVVVKTNGFAVTVWGFHFYVHTARDEKKKSLFAVVTDSKTGCSVFSLEYLLTTPVEEAVSQVVSVMQKDDDIKNAYLEQIQTKKYQKMVQLFSTVKKAYQIMQELQKDGLTG